MCIKNEPIYELGDVLRISSDYGGDEDTFGEVVSIKKRFAKNYGDNLFDYVYELSGARELFKTDNGHMSVVESGKLGYDDGNGQVAVAITGKVGEVEFTKKRLKGEVK